MSRTKSGVATAVSLIGLMLASQAHAESGGNDQEIALLRQQLRLLEQKLDKLQKQTSANTGRMRCSKNSSSTAAWAVPAVATSKHTPTNQVHFATSAARHDRARRREQFGMLVDGSIVLGPCGQG